MMGILEELKNGSNKFNDNVAMHGMLIVSRLDAIERAILEANKPNWDVPFYRLQIRGTKKAEQQELAIVEMNEMWSVETIVADGIQEKSPALVIEKNGLLAFSILKEGVGFEGVGGDEIWLPGESITFTPRAEGKFNICLTIRRLKIPTRPLPVAMGESSDSVYSRKATHDVARDVIMTDATHWQEPQPETVPAMNRTGRVQTAETSIIGGGGGQGQGEK